MKILLTYKIRKIFFTLLMFSWLPTGWAFAQQIRVVATFPDLADITRQIGKELVSVESLATGVEDPHGVPVRPSFVPRLNRADVLVVTGLDDEHSWLPALLEVANNAKILAWPIWLHRLLGGRIGARSAHPDGSCGGRSSSEGKSALYVGPG